MAKNKKRKPKQGKKFRPNLVTVVRQAPKISYRKVTCKYLADTDSFQVYLDMTLNGTLLRLLGLIDPNQSYDKGIRIFTKAPQRWMTCTEVQIKKEHAPGLFTVLTAYCHTIGDLLDDGTDVQDLPQGLIYNEGEAFKDDKCIELYKNVKEASTMRCPKCNSTYIGRTFKYAGTFIMTQTGEQISDNLTPVPSGQYWRCLDCNAKVRKVGDVDAWDD